MLFQNNRYIFALEKKLNMIESFNIDRRFSCLLDISERLADEVICSAEPVRPLALDYNSVCHATGMELSELIDFLDSKHITHSEFGIDFGALGKLQEWYIKKMRRYVRNALAHGLEPGSAEDIIFYEFCREYSKFGHHEVKSWNDIDEEKLLDDFVSKCLADFFDSSCNYKSKHFLLDQIHKSYLFNLCLKKPFPPYRVKIILSFILCNRYHIFTAEADSNVDTTDIKANWPVIFQFNPPRSAARHVFASRAKAQWI